MTQRPNLKKRECSSIYISLTKPSVSSLQKKSAIQLNGANVCGKVPKNRLGEPTKEEDKETPRPNQFSAKRKLSNKFKFIWISQNLTNIVEAILHEVFSPVECLSYWVVKLLNYTNSRTASPTPRTYTTCAIPKRGAMTKARHPAPFRNADGPSFTQIFL